MTQLQRRFLPSTSFLAAFEAVSRLGSFSAAAEELSLTQGAVSRQVIGLERQLGVRLFDRHARSVSLTAQGSDYARSIAEALAIIRTSSVNLITRRHENVLKLAVLPTFGTRWLMPRLPGFLKHNPGIIVELATRIGQFDFAREGLHGAIHVGRPDWPGAHCRLLMHEVVVPVCSPDFLRAHRIGTPGDLLALPLLHLASRPGAWKQWFESAGVSGAPREGMRFEQFLNVAQACMAGLGVALMPQFLILPELESGQLVPALEHRSVSPSSYYLVSALPWDRLPPPFRAFADWMMKEVEEFNRAHPEQHRLTG